jgi:rRNA-processing protein EBP2
MPKPNKGQNKRKTGEGGGSKLKEEDLDVLISTAETIEPETKRPKNKIKSSSLHKKVTFEEGSADQLVPDSATLAEQERLDREREFLAYYEIKSKYQKENVVDAALLNQKLQDVKLVHNGEPVEWVETLACLSEKPPIKNPNDDLSRELSFYNQALDTLKLAKPLLQAANVPFLRPDDYFAEMLKSDEHMAKVRKKLLGEQERIKSAEGRRRQRELKTFGKKVQIEKEQEKEKRKKANIESIKKWRKDQKRDKSLNELLNDDSDFNRDKPNSKGGKAKSGHKRDRDGNPISSLPVFKPKKFKNPVHQKKAGGRGGKSSKGKGRRK